MTLLEREALLKVIRACKKVLEYMTPDEQNHFEESCGLEEGVGEATYKEILEVAKLNKQEDHIFLQLLIIEENLPKLEFYLRTSKHPLEKYSSLLSEPE